MVEKRAQVVEQFKQLQSETDSVLKILTEPEVRVLVIDEHIATINILFSGPETDPVVKRQQAAAGLLVQGLRVQDEHD